MTNTTDKLRLIKYTILDIDYCKKEYPALWDTFRVALPALSDQDIATSISIAVGVCPYCWQENRYTCVCMDGE